MEGDTLPDLDPPQGFTDGATGSENIKEAALLSRGSPEVSDSANVISHEEEGNLLDGTPQESFANVSMEANGFAQEPYPSDSEPMGVSPVGATDSPKSRPKMSGTCNLHKILP